MGYLVSVVIPVYNKENKIRETFQSIVNQTYKNYEIVIIDDGSKDRGIEIIRELLSLNNSIKYKIIIQKNSGVSIARNKGIENSSGEYIFFIDGDDIIKPECLETLVNNMIHNKSDMSVCGFKVMENNKVVNQLYTKGICIHDMKDYLKMFIMGKTYIYMGNALYKRKIIIDNNIEFDNKYKYNEDQIFAYKYIISCRNIVQDNGIYFIYFRGKDSATMKAVDERYSNINIFLDFIKYLGNDKFSEINDTITKLIYNYKIPVSILNACYDLIGLNYSIKQFINVLNTDKYLFNMLGNYSKQYSIKRYYKINLLRTNPYLMFYIIRLEKFIKKFK
ncbi:MAG: glycosyltransferase family 2 protein [Clostridium sp.]|uniref:glycosyltransferase family 2 protein n=1 Tax=Clostridium sp. TaxID=1506 RepID=UPI003D6CEA20